VGKIEKKHRSKWRYLSKTTEKERKRLGMVQRYFSHQNATGKSNGRPYDFGHLSADRKKREGEKHASVRKRGGNGAAASRSCFSLGRTSPILCDLQGRGANRNHPGERIGGKGSTGVAKRKIDPTTNIVHGGPRNRRGGREWKVAPSTTLVGSYRGRHGMRIRRKDEIFALMSRRPAVLHKE